MENYFSAKRIAFCGTRYRLMADEPLFAHRLTGTLAGSPGYQSSVHALCLGPTVQVSFSPKTDCHY